MAFYTYILYFNNSAVSAVPPRLALPAKPRVSMLKIELDVPLISGLLQ